MGFLNILAVITLFGTSGITYIANIVELVKYGSIMETSSIFFSVAGIFIPPLGMFFGGSFLVAQYF